MKPWNWLHRHGYWREVNSTMHSFRGHTRARYHTRLPLPRRAVHWLAQKSADQQERRVFVARVHEEPRYRGLRAWEVTYR